jgi:hypothetical protein
LKKRRGGIHSTESASDYKQRESDAVGSALKGEEKISGSFHLLKGIHPYQGLQVFLLSGYINLQMARILKTSGFEIGPDNRIS